MKSACSPSRGFTLVELMVSIALLSILVVILCAMANSISATVHGSWAKLESDQAARVVLDRIQIDIQNMLLRPDVDYEFLQQTGNDQIAFYSTQPGYTPATGTPPTKRVATVVNYLVATSPTTNQPVMERGSNDAFQWTAGGMVFSTTPTIFNTSSTGSTLSKATTVDVLSPDVFRIELSFILKNPASGVYNPVAQIPSGTPISNVAGIIVTLAVLDGPSRKIVGSSTAAWTALTAALVDATSSTGSTPATQSDTARTWNNAIQSPTFATTAQIPIKVAQAVRVYERYYYLNSTPVPVTSN